MIIKRATLKKILQSFSELPIESGGIIGRKNGKICSLYIDSSYSNDHCYIPDIEKLNKTIVAWALKGIEFAGIIHSHPNGLASLSQGDIQYAYNILDKTKMKYIYFPVITQNKQGKCKLYVYRIDQNQSIEREKIIIFAD